MPSSEGWVLIPQLDRLILILIKQRETFIPGGGLPYKKGGDARFTSLGLKSWVLVPLRVFKAKYLHLHTTQYLLGVLRSVEWHFI